MRYLNEENSMAACVPHPQSKDSLSSGAGRKTTRATLVLLVDDDDGIRSAMQRILTYDGYTVIEAANATEALAAIDSFGPTIGVLITDIVMPGMHGDELARTVCQRFPHIAVLLISAYGDAHELTSRLQKPGCRFLAKPFTLQTFLDTVAGLVPSAIDP
jgi:two-component system cell cycle sensor histidine kinase/response regulator CckA